MKNNRSQKRLALIFTGVSLLFVICILTSVRLVRNYGAEYSIKALTQTSGTKTSILAEPGCILDVNGTCLTLTDTVYRLILDPKVMLKTEETYPGTVEKTTEIASQVFGIDQQELIDEVYANESSSYLRPEGGYILSEDQVEAYNTAKTDFNTEKDNFNKNVTDSDDKITAKVAGIWFEKEYRSDYPLGTVLSKVIGYTTESGEEGVTGLELYYDDVLRGTNGSSITYVTEDGSVTTEVEEPVNGCNLKTSLDANVARIIQEDIAEFQEEIGAERINVLVMNPNNGEIIAMVSDTDYDLNDPSDLSALFSEEELEHPEDTFLLQEAFSTDKDALSEKTHEELLQALVQQVQSNYCVSSSYEPGSTSKGLTLAACMEEGVLQEDTVTTCTHQIPIANYIIHCHMTEACGDLTPIEAYANSCNVCFVKYGLALGAERMAKYQELFNLGQKTGIDLPGEANTSYLIYSADTFSDIELATNAFGQGYNLTMVQMASAYSSLINGGYYYEPHVVTEITDLEGNTVKKIEPTLVRRTVSTETSEYMKKAMRFVITNGTANLLNSEPYMIGGKTGAAEKLPRGTGKYIVSFISAAPIDDPQYLVYCVVDEPHVDDQSQSLPAQKLALKVWQSLSDYWGIYPETDDDAYTYDWSSMKSFDSDDSLQDDNGVIQEITVTEAETAAPEETAAVSETETPQETAAPEETAVETVPAETEINTEETDSAGEPPAAQEESPVLETSETVSETQPEETSASQ